VSNKTTETLESKLHELCNEWKQDAVCFDFTLTADDEVSAQDETIDTLSDVNAKKCCF